MPMPHVFVTMYPVDFMKCLINVVILYNLKGYDVSLRANLALFVTNT